MRYLEVVPGRATLRDGAEPDAPPGWASVRVDACGVCGTDLHLLHGMELPRGRTYPVRPGHEVAGTLVSTGETVVLHPVLPCGECAACVSGYENRCRTAGAIAAEGSQEAARRGVDDRVVVLRLKAL